jgi:hypothetical protein
MKAGDRLVQIEVAYRPTRGKAGEVREAIDDAVDALFLRLTEGLIEAGSSSVRHLREDT